MRELKNSNPFRLVWQSKVGPLPWLEPATDKVIESNIQRSHRHTFKLSYSDLSPFLPSRLHKEWQKAFHSGPYCFHFWSHRNSSRIGHRVRRRIGERARGGNLPPSARPQRPSNLHRRPSRFSVDSFERRTESFRTAAFPLPYVREQNLRRMQKLAC